MDPALQIVIIVFCVIMSAYFSASETAFSTLNKIRLKNLAEKGNQKAAKTLAVSENFDELISSILIGNNVVNILSTSIATMLFVSLLGREDLGATVSTVIMTLVVLIFGEISPKTIAKKNPEAFAIFSTPLMQFLLFILKPFTFIFSKWQNLLAKIFKPSEDSGMTEEELISIIEEAEEGGDINAEEGTLIKSAIEFNDVEVGDIFTPRIDITAVSKDATKDEISSLFTESGYSRLPVYEGDLDNVVGIINYKDFFATGIKADVSIEEIIKPVIYVPKTQAINDLLKELQKKQMHFAVVMDEFGSTAGIVTLEDILEEIVGEIWDEHDEIVEEIKEVGEKEYMVSGMASISKLFDLLDINEVCESTTVNGWATSVLGRLPEVGDKFEALGLEVEILSLDGKRVEKLKIVDIRTDENEEDEGDDADTSGVTDESDHFDEERASETV